jgi:hypothetical protein
VTRQASIGRVKDLLSIPGDFVRGVSYEPALGPLDLEAVPGLDWIIIGGESGEKPAPFDLTWAGRVLLDCRGNRVAAFMKQLGSAPMREGRPRALPGESPRATEHEWPAGTRFGNLTAETYWNGLQALLRHPKGGDWTEWPETYRVRQMPRAPKALQSFLF